MVLGHVLKFAENFFWTISTLSSVSIRVQSIVSAISSVVQSSYFLHLWAEPTLIIASYQSNGWTLL